MESFEKWPLLAALSSPEDLKAMDAPTVDALAAQIRDYLIFRVGENGGHLASNLGVVELTLAIHRVFDAPRDHVVFDVGHQSYVHKLITGRKERFDTLRQPGGLSGFTKRDESVYDPFGAGHSSTAVSAAVGLAEAEAKRGSGAYTVAVVGDGALTGGLSYEGLNNCRSDLNLILIINENEMSISPNTGQLARHLSRIRASRRYLRTKEFASGALRHFPLIGKPIYRVLQHTKRLVKHIFYRENLFEHMGIRYLGPVESGDTKGLEACLRHAKRIGGAVLLHLKTRKGQGYEPAERDPNAYHSLSAQNASGGTGRSFSAVVGEELVALAGRDERICAITAAMSCGTGLEPFRAAHPERFFDVGIAEGHAVTFAAGLAAGGMKPVVALYSTFLQRAVDNLLHDAALQRLPVVLCVDRAGLNAGDGVTHHGIFDVAMLSSIPGVRIYAPVTEIGVRRALNEALEHDGVAVVRYPNGCEDQRIKEAFYKDGEDCPLGVRSFGAEPSTAQITLVTHGRMVQAVLGAHDVLTARGVRTRVVLCEYLTPFDRLSREVAPHLGGTVLLCEEEVRAGSFGINLCDALLRASAMENRKYAIVATENAFVEPLPGQSVQEAAGVDMNAVVKAAEQLLKEKENRL